MFLSSDNPGTRYRAYRDAIRNATHEGGRCCRLQKAARRVGIGLVNELTRLTDNQAARLVDLEEDLTALQEPKEEVLRQHEVRQREVLER